MIFNLVPATECDKHFFWDNYCHSMRSHIEEMWGWDESWQRADFETRWMECENYLVRINELRIGYIQSVDYDEEHYIMMLILLPEYRSKGIGRQLLAQVKGNATLKYIGLRVFRTNLKALCFYESQGFSRVESEGDFFYLKQKVL